MKEQILVFNHTDKQTLGAVRCIPGLRAAENGDHIWLRGIAVSEKIDIRIRQLPALHTYFLDERNRLFPAGGVTPTGTLPSLSWQPLTTFISVELPVSVLPGKFQRPYIAQLVPSGQDKPGAALLVSLATWKAYAETAPEIRLQQVRFAVSEKEEVFIIGDLLPSIPGKEYWRHNTLLVPSGYDFDPPLITDIIEKKLNPQKGNLLVFHSSDEWELIPLSCFVPATRSAIRLTQVSHETK
ncbi:hypothetical protein QNI16_04480 [Cytophagaceae bacterium YF14B1]|uniref:MoxR-vWA-beta-propeller ternary system domain-containing protein n=1 Tax=Xanthocytophaga flava TaxID=3048013 RepID=A0AAE3QJ05_9BACT|nr:hypothetical protein [Xanthocytophaga flavus]MDJ1479730.1 hypothetical protein [Xanthocytophaga flavus]